MTSEPGRFSFARWWAIVVKEFIQLKRDKPTFGMIVGIPIMQLFLFGYAINNDPKHLPTVIVPADNSVFTRSFVAGMNHTDYFNIIDGNSNETDAALALESGKAQFVITIPPDFTKKLLRGEQPSLLVEADATDPTAVGGAAGAIAALADEVIRKDFRGAIPSVAVTPKTPYNLILHRRYNPESITQYNIVPGLMGLILTMTLVMMTSVSITREREHGTMENLLAMPANPLEVMSGKMVPYIFIGFIQSAIILVCAKIMFSVPFEGSLSMMVFAIILFIAANLTVGVMISSFAYSQMQATQLTTFYFLPSILLSGFMFPFQGMPVWAQVIGEGLPLTYFNRIVKGIMLKGSGWEELWPNIWPLLIINVVVLLIGLKFYRKTLD